MRTSVQHFAELGNPLATADDWQREMALACNPNANTAPRASALDYVRPAKPYHPPRPKAPRDYVVTNPERLAQAQAQRANLTAMLRALETHSPAPMLAEAKKPRPALERPEPGFVPLPKRKPKSSAEKRAEHRAWLTERQIENLAKSLGLSPSELKDKLA